MTRRICAALAALFLFLFLGVAHADWTAPDQNLEKYTQAYTEAAAGYKLLKYGASTQQVARLKTALAALGFFPYTISENYYHTLETAVRLFAQQMRVGGDGREITPLLQAMILDTDNMPRARVPVVNTAPYAMPEGSSTFTPYTYARLTRASVALDTQVGFPGRIAAKAQNGDTIYYVVRMEDSPDKIVYVAYQPIPHTTVFQAGDAVTVLGITRGKQALPYPGMEAEVLVVEAERVGYRK
ncbi:MAG: hypothetical protein FWF69_00025 [Firmicutes bacterium]|nr:hypothetical protein [Bacillota bacterium]